MEEVNLTELPSGRSYEDCYQGYMRVFQRIALSKEERVVVIAPPWSWVPLLLHLWCTVVSPRHVFQHCPVVAGALANSLEGFDGGVIEPNAVKNFDRTLVEVLVSFRPECADALWKCDMQWSCRARVRDYAKVDEFIVTTNGAFYRPEVLQFLSALRQYVPTKRKVLLVPCAADKPYPAPLHEACLRLLPDDFYLMNVTGVLGLVPQDLWRQMPHYDSGIPNQWRVFRRVARYFRQFPHDRVVVYCDFYNLAIKAGFDVIYKSDLPEFIFPARFYHDYLDLLNPERLDQLAEALRGSSSPAYGCTDAL